MRGIPVLLATLASACLALPASAATAAPARVQIPAPMCDSGADAFDCWIASSGVPAPTGNGYTWTVTSAYVTPDPKTFTGQPPWLDINCHFPGIYHFSASYILSGVTYTSGTTTIACSNRPWP